MRPRHDLIETFSTFVQFEDDRFRSWSSDPRLRRNMQRCWAQESATAKSTESARALRFWVLYWHKRWQALPQSLARAHLLAYLQESCYWMAYKAGVSFTSTQYGVSDCFQLAITHLDKVLRGFDPEQGFDLKSYATAAFSSLIRDRLRQRQEVDICTDWSLLRKVSQKRLVAALAERGLGDREIEYHLLAWRAYKLIYVPTQSGSTRRLAAPTPSTWEAIIQQANADRGSLSEAAASHLPKAISRPQVESWLAQAAKAVRSYLYPSAVSMNALMAGQEGSEYLDSLTDDDQAPPLTAIISQEEVSQRAAQHSALNAVLKGAIAQLEPASQRLLTLYYQEGATQQAIATELGLKQYAISRALTRIKKALITALSQWSQAQLHIAPAPDVVKHTSAAIDEWLIAQYRPSSGSDAPLPKAESDAR